MASIWQFVILAVFLLLATTRAAPSSAVEDELVIPEGCKGPGFCAIKPEGYDQLEKKINSVLPEILWNLGSRH